MIFNYVQVHMSVGMCTRISLWSPLAQTRTSHSLLCFFLSNINIIHRYPFFFPFFIFVSLIFSHTIHPHCNLLSLHSSHQPPSHLPSSRDLLLMCFPSEESRPPSGILHSTVWNLTSLLLWPLFKWHQSFAEMISLRVLALLFFPLDTTSRTIWIKHVSLPIPPHPKAFVAIQVTDNKTSRFFCGLKG